MRIFYQHNQQKKLYLINHHNKIFINLIQDKKYLILKLKILKLPIKIIVKDYYPNGLEPNLLKNNKIIIKIIIMIKFLLKIIKLANLINKIFIINKKICYQINSYKNNKLETNNNNNNNKDKLIININLQERLI